MNVEEINSVFEGGRVIVPAQGDAEELLKSGYGTQLDDGPSIVLAPWEALYLLANSRTGVIDSETKENLDFQSLLGKFRQNREMKPEEDEIWTRYLIYRDLRKRGYVVREGTGWGITFRVYERGTYGEKVAKYLIFVICEWNAVPIDKVKEVLRLVQGMKRELIVAVMDRRGEVVYYSLITLNL